jgi:hypothetical protein
MGRRNTHSFTRDRARDAAMRRWHPPSPHRSDDATTPPATPEREGTEATARGPRGRVQVEEHLWEEAANSSSATSRVQALRELRAMYAAQPEGVPVEEVARRGIALADVLEAAIACSVISVEEVLARAESVGSS